MKFLPEKLRQYPFVTWAMVLLTIGALAAIFGRENVWALIEAWTLPAASGG